MINIQCNAMQFHFSGDSDVTPSHRARIPQFTTTAGVPQSNAIYALNMQQAVFYRRSNVLSITNGMITLIYHFAMPCSNE
jgi:hypothetical protein